MDDQFVKYVEEIEKHYINLPKLQRIRIEKWVEKLISIGSNTVFRKHRNAYAKLLLSMVLKRSLSEPFTTLPPDGPLPSYPFHIRPVPRNLSGSHENQFWKEAWNRIHSHSLQQENISSSNEFKENVDAFHHHKQHNVSFSSSFSIPKRSSSPSRMIGSPAASQPVLSHEITNLQLLVKEQEQKILFLEQQLHEQKMKHELQIQRMHYTHRMEINQLLNKKTPTENEISFTSQPETGFSRHIPDYTVNMEQTLGKPFSERQHQLNTTWKYDSQLDTLLNKLSLIDQSTDTVGSQLLPANHHDDEEQHQDSDSFQEHGNQEEQDEKENESVDIVPVQNKGSVDNSSLAENNDDYSHVSLSKSTVRWKDVNDTLNTDHHLDKEESKELKNPEDEEYLNYMEQFQNRMQKVNFEK
jgi:hypothetical protein